MLFDPNCLFFNAGNSTTKYEYRIYILSCKNKKKRKTRNDYVSSLIPKG